MTGAPGALPGEAIRTASGLSPQAWAVKAIALWRRLEADQLVAEVNMGGRRQRAGGDGARHARQISARRAGVAALRTGPRQARRAISGAGGRDVRLRARRPVVRPLARPARRAGVGLSLIHISEPTRLGMISYAVFCLKK